MVSKFTCPNKANHVSSEPAGDRERCPYCSSPCEPTETPVYVKKQKKGGA